MKKIFNKAKVVLNKDFYTSTVEKQIKIITDTIKKQTENNEFDFIAYMEDG